MFLLDLSYESKYEVANISLPFKKMVENLTNKKIKVFQSNQGGEYHPLKLIMDTFGIVF